MSVEFDPENLNLLNISDVNCYDIWDRRECAVSNPDFWRSACEQYKSSANFKNGIPHTMHQIWIGTRQPPCVWLDTWRVDFMSRFQKDPTNPNAPPWNYVLWDNEKVRNMHMLNRELFDAESAPQCQADILRLEVLYEYGGVYIDADIVSTVRDLRPALADAADSGFMITYEPDTKDKPYSILGNSLIACTPKHPLILMLMSYIKSIYAFKRAHYGVEWVTGPLTYTKVLIHTGMPLNIPEQKDFYPAFHYVPNPSTIDVTKLDAYCFQFGYTCSGLSQWVAENNKCRRAHECSYHANIQYPLGSLKKFPKVIEPVPESAEIPPIIHQFYFGCEDAAPTRWIDTWRKTFCPATGFKHELWTWNRLKEEIGSFFCANLYEEYRLDTFSIGMLALEVLNARGGYYVPLTTTFAGDESQDNVVTAIFGSASSAHFETTSVIGLPVNSGIARIKAAYDAGSVSGSANVNATLPAEFVADMRYGDDTAALAEFKPGSRFLGADTIYFHPEENGDSSSLSADSAALVWAYDCQVPIFKPDNNEALLTSLRASDKRAIVITDSQFGVFSSLVNELPGVMYRLDQANADWDFIVINLEWEVDDDGLCEYTASCSLRAPTARYLGFIVNNGAADKLQAATVDDVLMQHDSGKVFVVSEKTRHSAKLASIFRTMPAIEHACRSLSGFTPSFERDGDEVHDNLFKGFRDGQVAFELQVDDQNRVMYRAWGEDRSIVCECRILPGMSGTQVEALRVFSGAAVLHESFDKFIR